MKKLFALALALCLVFALFACTANTDDDPNTTTAAAELVPFDLVAFRTAAEAAVTMEEVADLINLLEDHPGVLPDEALLVYEAALDRVALAVMMEAWDLDWEWDWENNIFHGVAFADMDLPPQFLVMTGLEGGGPCNGHIFIDYEAIEQSLQGQLSESAVAWLRLMDYDTRNRIADDAALIISWDELATRMLAWEAFERAHHPFVLALHEAEHRTTGWSQTLLGFYLLGIDNTPVFDWGPNTLLTQVRESYERFLADDANRSSEYFSIVEEAMAIWEANDWQFTYDFDRSPDTVQGQLIALLQLESPLIPRSPQNQQEANAPQHAHPPGCC